MLPGVTKALIDDPNVGMLFISFPINTAIPVEAFNEGMAHSPKPKVMVALGDTWKLGPDVEAAVKESPAVYLPLVGPHAARDRALYQIRTLAGAHARRPKRRRLLADCHNSVKAPSLNGSANRSSPPRAFACQTAPSRARPTKRPLWRSGSAILWPSRRRPRRCRTRPKPAASR